MSFNNQKEDAAGQLLLSEQLEMQGVPLLFGAQISRVLARIAPALQWGEPHEPAGIIAAFRSKGLIPPYLVSLFKSRKLRSVDAHTGDYPAEELLAVCFAACVYPQRAYQIASTMLGFQVEAFLNTVEAIDTTDTADDQSAQKLARTLISIGCLPSSLTEADALALFSDLSAADCVPALDPASAAEEQKLRRLGAALYLACCYKEITERIVQTWTEEAELIRYIRNYLVTTPSNLTRQDQTSRRKPHWDEVKHDLTQMLPGAPVALHEQAVIIEKMVWSFAAKFLAPELLSDRITDFWESRWEKLISGFPYYAFRSRFGRWWKQCMIHYNFPRAHDPFDEEKINLGLSLSPGDGIAAEEITPEQLRWFREGYRLARSTFFERQDKKQGDGDDHESLRKVLDAIWYHRLETRLGDELPEQTVKQITGQFPSLNRNRIHFLSLHLRRRMWAYALARLGRLSNSRILSAKRPAEYGRQDGTEYPLKSESGVKTIASLARVAPLENTLLWPLGAHLFLHPKVEPQRPDRWTFKRFLREVWRMVKEETFDAAVHNGAAAGSRVDAAALKAFVKAPLKELVDDLKKAKTEPEMESDILSRQLQVEQETSLDIVCRLAQDDLLKSADNESFHLYCKQAWDGKHWIVPVWYLTVLEQFNEQQILERLQVDEAEIEMVVRLSRTMAARRSKSNSL